MHVRSNFLILTKKKYRWRPMDHRELAAIYPHWDHYCSNPLPLFFSKRLCVTSNKTTEAKLKKCASALLVPEYVPKPSMKGKRKPLECDSKLGAKRQLNIDLRFPT